jgi:hypothetical protein
MQEEKSLVELLKMVYNSIRTRTPKRSGFCSLVRLGEGMPKEEKKKLIEFFENQAESTHFVNTSDIKEYNAENVTGYYCIGSMWLYLPNDWKSRRKWLKEYIQNNKQEVQK